MLPDEAFGTTPFATDWMDTAESQRLLSYQRYSLAEFTRELRSRLGIKRLAVRLFRPAVRLWLLKQSPFSEISLAKELGKRWLIANERCAQIGLKLRPFFLRLFGLARYV